MVYTPTNWVNGTTPINATNLNHIEAGIVAAGGGLVANGTDDTTQINAAITALGSNGGTVRLTGTGFKISSTIVFPTGVGLVGDGQNMEGSEVAGTRILCLDADSGLRFDGSGGLSMGFTVNGNNVATTCIKQTIGAGRVFIAVEAEDALSDNWVIQKTQNAVYLGCQAQGAGRDNLVLDLGCGGLHFLKFEANDAGRYSLYIQQSGSSPEVYANPTHITFATCLFERQAADQPAVNITAAEFIEFTHCVIHTGVTGGSQPLINLTNTGTITFDESRFFVGSAVNHFSMTSNFPRLIMKGYNDFYGPASGTSFAFHATVGNIFLPIYPQLNTNVSFVSGSTTIASRFVTQMGVPTATTVGAAGGASALPATPTGYLIVGVNGTSRKIPYYAT